jgi:hypothetical protein
MKKQQRLTRRLLARRRRKRKKRSTPRRDVIKMRRMEKVAVRPSFERAARRKEPRALQQRMVRMVSAVLRGRLQAAHVEARRCILEARPPRKAAARGADHALRVPKLRRAERVERREGAKWAEKVKKVLLEKTDPKMLPKVDLERRTALVVGVATAECDAGRSA